MPLSDREKRLLEEMEAALLTEDPRLVSALSSKAPVSPSRNRIMVRGRTSPAWLDHSFRQA
jgi:hypothetical protein